MRSWRLLLGGPGASRERSWRIGAPEICIQIPKVSQFGTHKGRAPLRRWIIAPIATELSSAFFSKDPTFSRLASLRVPGINLARDCICPFDVLQAQKPFRIGIWVKLPTCILQRPCTNFARMATSPGGPRSITRAFVAYWSSRNLHSDHRSLPIWHP